MDANQRSEVNNQTNNGANEKGPPQAKGTTRDGVTEQATASGTGMAQPDLASRSRELGNDTRDTVGNAAGSVTGSAPGTVPGAVPGTVAGTAAGTAAGTEAGVPGVQSGDIYGNRQGGGERRADTQDASASKIQQSTDREGAQTGATRRDPPPGQIHQSNDAAGGLPRSPGGANQLAGDRKMDDDTGFSRG